MAIRRLKVRLEYEFDADDTVDADGEPFDGHLLDDAEMCQLMHHRISHEPLLFSEIARDADSKRVALMVSPA